jgi:hypothetical protein
MGNRQLLWHGTNVAVVVAIMNSGLRIMPHSGGRVGKGIYFASESSKSSGYVTPNSYGTGFMFLNEVALGKEHHITSDNSRLKSPPKGFDSVVAQGHTEPDRSVAVTVDLDGKDVVMAMGSPQYRLQYATSSFSQTEFLVYKESQVHIRYLLKLQYPGFGSTVLTALKSPKSFLNVFVNFFMMLSLWFHFIQPARWAWNSPRNLSTAATVFLLMVVLFVYYRIISTRVQRLRWKYPFLGAALAICLSLGITYATFHLSEISQLFDFPAV